MKFIHLSDLHLGKRVNEISMTDDQQYFNTRIRSTYESLHTTLLYTDEKQDFDIALETFGITKAGVIHTTSALFCIQLGFGITSTPNCRTASSTVRIVSGFRRNFFLLSTSLYSLRMLEWYNGIISPDTLSARAGYQSDSSQWLPSVT